MQVKHEHRSVAALAILDQCSDVSLCTNQLLQRLSINGTPKPFTVNTVLGQTTDELSVQTDLLVTNKAGTKNLYLKNVRSVPALPINVSSMAGTELTRQLLLTFKIRADGAFFSDTLLGV